MSRAVMLDAINRLSIEERIALVEEIWDAIIDDRASDLPLTASQERTLRDRVAFARAHPEAGSPWREALDEIERAL